MDWIYFFIKNRQQQGVQALRRIRTSVKVKFQTRCQKEFDLKFSQAQGLRSESGLNPQLQTWVDEEESRSIEFIIKLTQPNMCSLAECTILLPTRVLKWTRRQKMSESLLITSMLHVYCIRPNTTNRCSFCFAFLQRNNIQMLTPENWLNPNRGLLRQAAPQTASHVICLYADALLVSDVQVNT